MLPGLIQVKNKSIVAAGGLVITPVTTQPPPDTTNNGNPYTFTGVDIGPDVAKIVIVCANLRTATNDDGIDDIVIGGASGTNNISHVLVSGSKKNSAAIWSRSLSGTTATITVSSISNGGVNCTICVYYMTGAVSTVAHDADFGIGTDPTTALLDIPAGGGAVFIGSSGGGSFTATPVGLTNEAMDQIVETNTVASGYQVFVGAQTQLPCGADWSGTPTAGAPVMVAASWPAA